MTSAESALSQLIGQIYDAALDPALWPGVMERICGFVGGSIANLYAAMNDLRHVLSAVPGVTLVLRDSAYALELSDTARLAPPGATRQIR